MEDIFAKLYDMTAFSNIIADPSFLIMYAIAFILLYLGIRKHYEPLLLVPIAFGVLIANFPGGDMGVIQADENGMVMVNGVLKNIWEMPLHEIAHDLGLMNFIYYMLIKTGFLPPVIFMGVGALTDFGPMLRNLRLSIFGAAAQLGHGAHDGLARRPVGDAETHLCGLCRGGRGAEQKLQEQQCFSRVHRIREGFSC